MKSRSKKPNIFRLLPIFVCASNIFSHNKSVEVYRQQEERHMGLSPAPGVSQRIQHLRDGENPRGQNNKAQTQEANFSSVNQSARDTHAAAIENYPQTIEMYAQARNELVAEGIMSSEQGEKIAPAGLQEQVRNGALSPDAIEDALMDPDLPADMRAALIAKVEQIRDKMLAKSESTDTSAVG